MTFRLRFYALFFASICALLAGALLSPPAARAASTTFGFSAADSATQSFSDGSEFYQVDVDFTLRGGHANVGLAKGVAKTIHVGVGDLNGDADDNTISFPGMLPHTLSLTGTVGTITQTLPQTDVLTTGAPPPSYDQFQSVDIPAGPTVTFDMGTQGRVDVTPQEYQYDTRNGSAPNFSYTLLLRSPAVPVSGVSVSPSTVTYPASTTGTVTLAKPAPDDETIVLVSSNPAVGVPAALAVAAGQQTATFPVTTDRVDTDTAVTISASAGGTTKSVILTVKTRPELAFTYSIGGKPQVESQNEQGAAVYFSAGHGSGTIKLALDTPYTIPVSTYSVSGGSGGPEETFASLDTTIIRTASINGQTHTLRQNLDERIRESSFVVDFNASLSDAPTVVYDVGAQGRVELTAAGFSVYQNHDTQNYTTPEAYTFTLRAPIAVSSLAVSPTEIYGGATTFGKITLAKAAGTGGQLVTLASSDPSVVTPPATFMVPAGFKTATFPITTATADEDAAVTLTATAGGKSVTAGLTVLARYQFSGTVKNGSTGLSGVTVGASSTGTFLLTSTLPSGGSIPDGSMAGKTTTINPKGTGTITGLVVGLDITHPRIGDLRVTLTGPDGTSAVLYNQSGGTQANLQTSYPVLRTPVDSLSVFNGKQVAGTWKLLVQDLVGGYAGTLHSWNLTFAYNGTVTGSGTTASDGTYTVSDLKEGTYTVTPTKSGISFTPASRSVTVGPMVVDPNPDGVDFAQH